MHDVTVPAFISKPKDPSTTTRVSVILVRALIEAVQAAGVPVHEFLSAANVADQQFETPYAWVEVGELDRLIQHALAITGDAAFGLHWSERSPMMKFDLLATATAYAPSLREALACVLRFQTLLCERVELTLVERPASLFLRFSPVGSSELAQRVRSELAISCLVRLMRHVGAPEAAVLRVVFTHSEPPYASEYARLLGDRVHFHQSESGIEIDLSWLDRRVHHANAELHRLLTTKAQDVLTRGESSVGYASQLRDYLRRVFPRVPDMREAARALALSERSLRRRLAEEGRSYSAVLHETRLLLAEQLLGDPTRSVKQVALAVGFADSPTFFRAFKRWTGQSPSAYRSVRLGAPSAITDENRACQAS